MAFGEGLGRGAGAGRGDDCGTGVGVVVAAAAVVPVEDEALAELDAFAVVLDAAPPPPGDAPPCGWEAMCVYIQIYICVCSFFFCVLAKICKVQKKYKGFLSPFFFRR